MNDLAIPQFVIRDLEAIRPIMRDVFANLLAQTGKSMDDPDDLADINEQIEMLRAESAERNYHAIIQTMREVMPQGGMDQAIKAVEDMKMYGPHERVLIGLCTEYDRLGFTAEQVKTAFTQVLDDRQLDAIEVFPWLPALLPVNLVWEPPSAER